MNMEVSRQYVYNRYTAVYELQGNHMNVEVSRQCVYNRYTDVYELQGSSYEYGGK